MTPADLSRTVLRAVRRAVDDGELGTAAAAGVEAGTARIVVERPRPGGHGDYATNVALQLAGPAGRPPRQVAEILSRHLAEAPGVASVDVTGPGFLNLTLSPAHLGPTAPGPASQSPATLGPADPGSVDPDPETAAPLYGHRIVLRIPHELRARVAADALARIARGQGADVDVAYAESAGDVTFRPVPARPSNLVELLGADAARWALLQPAAHDHPRTATPEDRAAYLVQRESNPLFRVRYAHARTRALTRNAADLGFDSAPGDVPGCEDLVAALADHPRILLAAARHHAPDRLVRHLVDVAGLFLTYLHPTVLPLGEEKPSAAHRARLALAEATGTVLAGGLSLLGIDAPEHL
ncbi:DALR anticodon-binding domain-containing protein [Streptomyces sp. Q6]|uniref:DALR anticodon-binding domain-containing protein n=1 Tax=Streptomyces citrinus TaxID=3118173 RepID=A0ACD5AHT5_9ACTN